MSVAWIIINLANFRGGGVFGGEVFEGEVFEGEVFEGEVFEVEVFGGGSFRRSGVITKGQGNIPRAQGIQIGYISAPVILKRSEGLIFS